MFDNAFTQRDSAKCAIVLPAYNVALYLRECLDSILAQTYTNFTVFAVDDGSTDETGEILDEYAKRDKRIQVFHTTNHGISAARNVALEHIETPNNFDYVAFVDSDDRVAPDMLKTLLSEALDKTADIVACAPASLYSSGKISLNGRWLPQHCLTLTKEDFLSLIFACGRYNNLCGCGGAVWKNIYKAQVIHGLRFEENRNICEDELFNTDVSARAKMIVYIPKILYFYRKRSTSFTSSPRFDLKLLEGRHKAFFSAVKISEKAAVIVVSSYIKAILESAKTPQNKADFEIKIPQPWIKKSLQSGLIGKKRAFQWFLLTEHPKLFSLYRTFRWLFCPRNWTKKMY